MSDQINSSEKQLPDGVKLRTRLPYDVVETNCIAAPTVWPEDKGARFYEVRVHSDLDGDVEIFVGEGCYVSAIRQGRGNGKCVIDGPGAGSVDRGGAGDGDAVRSGSGAGHARRWGKGRGNAMRSGDGAGFATRTGEGDGDAVRTGYGGGDARHYGPGRGMAYHEGAGPGDSFEYARTESDGAASAPAP